MSKPSIFSNRYDEKMKRRKKLRIILVVILILAIIGIVLFFIGGSNNILKRTVNKFTSKTTSDTKEVKKEEKKDNQTQVKPKEQVAKKQEVKTQVETVKLSNNQQVKLTYNIVNSKRQYVDFSPKTIQYSISNSKKYLVFIDKYSQSMILVDENGVKKDITKKEYVSTEGEKFSKETILKSKPQYIWTSTPKFIGDNTIAYISQLPWFNREQDKFVWKYNISNNSHEYKVGNNGNQIGGKSIEYGKLSKDGLQVVVDGNVNLINDK